MGNIRTYTCMSKNHPFTPLLKCKYGFQTIFLNFSSENRFVGGTESCHVAIFNGNSIEKSVKLSKNSDQNKNATLARYSDGRIYAVAEDSSITVLNMNLQIEKVFDQKVPDQIYAFVVTPYYVAVGGANGKVLVYDKSGDMLLVSFIL